MSACSEGIPFAQHPIATTLSEGNKAVVSKAGENKDLWQNTTQESFQPYCVRPLKDRAAVIYTGNSALQRQTKKSSSLVLSRSLARSPSLSLPSSLARSLSLSPFFTHLFSLALVLPHSPALSRSLPSSLTCSPSLSFYLTCPLSLALSLPRSQALSRSLPSSLACSPSLSPFLTPPVLTHSLSLRCLFSKRPHLLPVGGERGEGEV